MIHPRQLLRLIKPSGGITALAMVLLSAPLMQPARADSCSPDPFGGEICLPDPAEPPKSDDRTERPKSPIFHAIPGVPAGVIFDRRKPYRIYEPQEAAVEPEPTPEPTAEPEVAPEPIRGLWLKTGDLQNQVAVDFLNETLQQQLLAQVDQTTIATGETIRFAELDYLEILEPITLLYSHPYVEPGVTVWVNGYGGGDQAMINDRSADLSNGGVAFGFDVDLSETFRLGLYGNYSTAETSSDLGSWNPSGWGGGITADWWTESFYVQGLVGGTSFYGSHERKLNGENARGDRAGNSWNAAVRLGAPIDAGSIYLEPQAQLNWMGANFDSFRESGASQDQQLRYSSSSADSIGSELALKIGLPIRSNERSLFLPSLRLGWIANWGQNNSTQTVRYVDNGEKYSYRVDTGDANGLLLEAGLDYTTFNFSDTSVGVFVRGGPVFWSGDLGTGWRAWGGLSLNF